MGSITMGNKQSKMSLKQSLPKLQYSARASVALLGVGGLFTFLAGRIAFRSPFPLPYDEGFHFGLIRLYSHHLSPFLSSQPQGANVYGAVARDPSYLYHYLLSFPLRILQAAGVGEYGQVLALRGANIMLGLLTLYLVYRLARRFRVPKTGAIFAVLALAITPVFYELSAQVNYDNLLLPLTLLSVSMLLTILHGVRTGKLSAARLVGFVSLVLATSLVKYSFLPIALASFAYLGAAILRNTGLRKSAYLFVRSFTGYKPAYRMLLVSLAIIAGTLWVQRDGINIVKYHTPHPQCQAVLSVSNCMSYSPWARNYQLQHVAAQHPSSSLPVVAFTKYWFRAMYLQLYSNIQVKSAGVVVYSPYKVLSTLAKAVVLPGMLLAAPLLLRRRHMNLWVPAFILGAAYFLALWAQNFSDFHHLQALVAIQGRYLLPVLPFAYIFVAAGYCNAAQSIPSTVRALQTRIIMMNEGSTLRFISRSSGLFGTLRLV